MRAIGKWVAITPSTRIADFRVAIKTSRSVRHHAGARRRCAAGCDSEFCLRWHPGWGTLNSFNAGERRGAGQQAIYELGNSFRRTADVDGDALAVICHRSMQTVCLCQPPDRRAKADPLHQAAYRIISPISPVDMTVLHRADLDVALDVLQIWRDGDRDQNAEPDARDQPSNTHPAPPDAITRRSLLAA